MWSDFLDYQENAERRVKLLASEAVKILRNCDYKQESGIGG
jgi:hypothetical protein